MNRTATRTLIVALLGLAALTAGTGTSNAAITSPCGTTTGTAARVCHIAHSVARSLAAPAVPARGNATLSTLRDGVTATGLHTVTALSSLTTRPAGKGYPYRIHTVTAVATWFAQGYNALIASEATVTNIPCVQRGLIPSLTVDCGTGTTVVTTRLGGTTVTLNSLDVQVQQPTLYRTYRATRTARGVLLATATGSWNYTADGYNAADAPAVTVSKAAWTRATAIAVTVHVAL